MGYCLIQVDLSVCIPIYDPKETNKTFVIHALRSINQQNILPREVVLTSMHSIGYLKELRSILNPHVILKTAVARTSGASENFNNSVKLASGTYIKILCQDDYMLDVAYLSEIVQALKISKSGWVVTSSQKIDDENKINFPRINPKYTTQIINGKNLIGSPSVAAFTKLKFLQFSRSLHYMYDCEWYVRMQHNYGDPTFVNNVCVGIRIHHGQMTHQVSHLAREERRLSRAKHRKKVNLKNLSIYCACKKSNDL